MCLQVSIRPIDLLHLHQQCRFHIRQANDDGLHWMTSLVSNCSNRSSHSAIASRSGGCHSSHRHKTAQAHQRAFRCWGCGGDSRGKKAPPGNTPPFPQSRPRAALHPLGFSPTCSQSIRGQPARQGGGGERLGEGWEVLKGRGGYGSGSLVELTPSC